jgi:hypothetical protein
MINPVNSRGISSLMKNFYYILITVVLTASFSSCDEMGNICLSNQNSAQAGLYSAYTARDTVLTELYVHGIGNDSLLYDSVAISKLFLPLSMHADTSAFRIKVRRLIDTIWFVYKRDLSYVSGDCGLTVSIELDTIWFTNRFIDSVAIDYPFVEYNESIENVKIFID